MIEELKIVKDNNFPFDLTRSRKSFSDGVYLSLCENILAQLEEGIYNSLEDSLDWSLKNNMLIVR